MAATATGSSGTPVQLGGVAPGTGTCSAGFRHLETAEGGRLLHRPRGSVATDPRSMFGSLGTGAGRNAAPTTSRGRFGGLGRGQAHVSEDWGGGIEGTCPARRTSAGDGLQRNPEAGNRS
jgi:hypothetical protein